MRRGEMSQVFLEQKDENFGEGRKEAYKSNTTLRCVQKTESW